jgi:translation initiation factor IF-3
VNIDPHDYMIKVRHAEQFLDRGNKVKFQLQFRGRELSHKELGDQLMRRLKDDLLTMGQVEMEPKLMGKSINMTMSPLPLNKRKRKFTLENEDLPPEPPEEDE